MMSVVPAPPPKLIDAIRENNCVLFAGAGLSRGKVSTARGEKEQYLPTWNGLLIEMLNRASRQSYVEASEATKLQEAVRQGMQLFVAEAVRRILGSEGFAEAIEDIFRDARLRPTSRHELITQIPFSAVVTTNYDKLIETAYASSSNVPPVYTFENASDAIAAIRRNRFFLH
jgi:hypothetical protein